MRPDSPLSGVRYVGCPISGSVQPNKDLRFTQSTKLGHELMRCLSRFQKLLVPPPLQVSFEPLTIFSNLNQNPSYNKRKSFRSIFDNVKAKHAMDIMIHYEVPFVSLSIRNQERNTKMRESYW